MRSYSNEISRDEVRPGDHIFTYRLGCAYQHHGICVSDEKVIHFTTGRKGFMTSSSPNNEQQPEYASVLSSSLDCFLAGGSIHLFKYGVKGFIFLAKPRGGSCVTIPSDPPEEVIHRAEYLLQNGFGKYHLLKNNCENFAMYCKIGLVSIDKPPTCSQVYSGVKAAKILTGATAVTSLATMVNPVVGLVVGSVVVAPGCIGVATYWNICRLTGEKKLKKCPKVPVEDVTKYINKQL